MGKQQGFMKFAFAHQRQLERENGGHKMSTPELVAAANMLWSKLDFEAKREWKDKAMATTQKRSTKIFQQQFKSENRLFYSKEKDSRFKELKDSNKFKCVQSVEIRYNTEETSQSYVEWLKEQRLVVLHVEPHCFSRDLSVPAELAVVEFSLGEGFTEEMSWRFHLDQSAHLLPEKLYNKANQRMADHQICLEHVPEDRKEFYVSSVERMIEDLMETIGEESYLFILGSRQNYNKIQGCLEWIRNSYKEETGKRDYPRVIERDRLLFADTLLWQLRYHITQKEGESSENHKLITNKMVLSNIMEHVALASKCLCDYHNHFAPRTPQHCALAAAKMTAFFMFRELHKLYDLPLDSEAFNPDPFIELEDPVIEKENTVVTFVEPPKPEANVFKPPMASAPDDSPRPRVTMSEFFKNRKSAHSPSKPEDTTGPGPSQPNQQQTPRVPSMAEFFKAKTAAPPPLDAPQTAAADESDSSVSVSESEGSDVEEPVPHHLLMQITQYKQSHTMAAPDHGTAVVEPKVEIKPREESVEESQLKEEPDTTSAQKIELVPVVLPNVADAPVLPDEIKEKTEVVSDESDSDDECQKQKTQRPPGFGRGMFLNKNNTTQKPGI